MAIAPTGTRAIIDRSGAMTQQFRAWTQAVNNAVILIGAGTPETFVDALQGQLYMDTAGNTGTILYIKKFADIGGDKTQGWILV